MKNTRRFLTPFALLPALAVLFSAALAQALPEAGPVSRFGVAISTWQESLRLQSQTGQVDVSVANYKGFFLSFERQKRMKGGGYALGAAIGGGSASGGGTSDSIDYKRGAISWVAFQVQPRLIWALSESIDASLSVAGSYRSASWPESDTVKVTPSRQVNATVFVDLDFMLTEKLSFRQSFGTGSLETGLFMRWGLNYDL